MINYITKEYSEANSPTTTIEWREKQKKEN